MTAVMFWIIFVCAVSGAMLVCEIVTDWFRPYIKKGINIIWAHLILLWKKN